MPLNYQVHPTLLIFQELTFKRGTQFHTEVLGFRRDPIASFRQACVSISSGRWLQERQEDSRCESEAGSKRCWAIGTCRARWRMREVQDRAALGGGSGRRNDPDPRSVGCIADRVGALVRYRSSPTNSPPTSSPSRRRNRRLSACSSKPRRPRSNGTWRSVRQSS